jgi:DNA gyrase subunit A
MGRQAHGVKGISLEEGDEVVGMIVANGDDDPASLLTVCENGFGKRTLLTEYRSQNRGGKGLIDIKTTGRNGPVVAIAKITDADEVMLTTTRGILIRTPVATMRLIGRNTQGVRLIRIEEGDGVGSLARLPEEELTANGDLAEEGPDAPPVAEGGIHPPHILDDGVAGAEASDHIDDRDADGEPDA